MTKVFHWNGHDLPEELRALPPGDYVVTPIGDERALSPDEEEGLEQALDEVERGDTVDSDEVWRSLAGRRRPSITRRGDRSLDRADFARND